MQQFTLGINSQRYIHMSTLVLSTIDRVQQPKYPNSDERGEKDTVLIKDGILYSHEEKMKSCSNRHGTEGYNVKQNELEREGQTQVSLNCGIQRNKRIENNDDKPLVLKYKTETASWREYSRFRRYFPYIHQPRCNPLHHAGSPIHHQEGSLRKEQEVMVKQKEKTTY